jgi:hypothetical protein
MATQNGFYSGRLAEAGTAVAGEKKTPYIFLSFDIGFIAGPNNDWVELPTPIRGTVNMYLSDGAFAITEKQLAAIGFDGNFQKPTFAKNVYSEGITLECYQEEYKGEMKSKWRLPHEGYERESADRDTLTKLANRWKQSAAGRAKPAGPPPARPTVPPVADSTGDDTDYPEALR